MATSDSVDSGGYQGRVLRFEWGTNTTNSYTNVRNIWYKITAVGGSSSYYYHHNETIDINGSRVYTGSDSHQVYTNDVLASGSMDINQSNTTTLTVDMHGGIYSRTDNISTTKSWSLDEIPRYATFTNHKVLSKTLNSVTIQWEASDPCNDSATQYSINGGSWQNGGGYPTYTITGLTPNTTYSIKTRIQRKDSGLWTESSALSVTTYQIATLIEVPNINIGSSHTVKWTNPSGATTTLKLCKTDNSTIIDYGTVTGTSKTITPTADTIYALTPNSNTYTARYILTTTQNSVSYTNYKDFTFTVTNSNPTFTNYTYQDTNATTVALTGNNQILVKGYSNLKATVSTDNKAIAKNSATIKSYKLVSGSKSTSANYSSTADVSLSVNNVDSGTIVLYATDSRGNSTAVTKTATYKEYTDLVIKSVTAERGSNGVGQDVTLKFNGTYWNDSFGNVTNTITNAKYYYRETSASDWIEGETELTFTTENGKFSGDVSIKGDLGANGFDVSKAYYIRLEVSDGLVTKTYDITLGSGTPAIAIYKDNVAIGQKYDISDDSKLQVAGDISINGEKVKIIDVIDSLESDSETDALSAKQGKFLIEKATREIITAGVNRKDWTVTGSWQSVALLPFDYNNHVNEKKLTVTSDGIKVGAGVSKVLVSANFNGIYFKGFSGDVYSSIRKKTSSSTNSIKLAENYNTNTGVYYVSDSISPLVVDVAENDLLFLEFGSGGGGKGEILKAWLTVEVLE